MAWQCTGRNNEELVENLAKAHIISDPRVRQAMLKVGQAIMAAKQMICALLKCHYGHLSRLSTG